jgi:RHS repeat-associated protein
VLTDGVVGGASNLYVPGVSQKQAGAKKFVGSDRMGSNVNEFDSAKNTTMSKDYDAFGNVKTTTGSTTNRFGYASSWGYQSDAGSGLQLLGNRYYDPTIGRFLTKDPIKDGRNWYVYCASNSLRFVDYQGLDKISAGVGVGVLVPFVSISGDVSLVVDPSDVIGTIGIEITIGAGPAAGLTLPGAAITGGYEDAPVQTGIGKETAVGLTIGNVSMETIVDENGNVVGGGGSGGMGSDHGFGSGAYAEKRIQITMTMSYVLEYLASHPNPPSSPDNNFGGWGPESQNTTRVR